MFRVNTVAPRPGTIWKIVLKNEFLQDYILIINKNLKF